MSAFVEFITPSIELECVSPQANILQVQSFILLALIHTFCYILMDLPRNNVLNHWHLELTRQCDRPASFHMVAVICSLQKALSSRR